ncbi:aminotransferase class III-fold pyridoxal phosphate-dependent enzyme [Thermohalobacter berrensis]|uniref:Aminotransferase III n=1 Tax=Thermohalobacter berrensis TaxID=99594 RepID=A0A419T5E9_9FIRM|nr:aminotransferase class III-fold pyridoxal phosphate-dependent enzyme [Thermohalobacter berrensis]RKD32764.1 aminotransferase III [Thermohalobacter berrensis]
MNSFTKYVNPYIGELLEIIKMDKSFIRGEGTRLYDDKGNEYLDFIAAYGALPFGYNPNEIWETIDNFKKSKEPSFIQPSALNAAGELAKKLIEVTPEELKYVTFTNSGAETVEAGIKLCRSATGRKGILSTINSFHGKTLGALSATGKKSYQDGFGAPADGFNFIEYGNLEALENELKEKPDYYAAFIIEPIQGEGGIVEPPKGYLKGAKEICKKYGVKLIVDEIQTGLGRTGRLFAFEEEGVCPDVLLLAKALSGGIIPIGACIATEEVYNSDFGNKHSSTFAGNSLACRVGIKVLDILSNTDTIKEAKRKGEILKEGLNRLKEKYPDIIKSVRGRGLMLGIEFCEKKDIFPGSFIGIMAEQKLLTPIISSYLLNVEKLRVAPTLNGENVIRIEPPLIVTESECYEALNKIESMLEVLNRKNTAEFLSYLINVDKSKREYKEVESREIKEVEVKEKDERFAFLIHPLDLKNYTDYDKSLLSFNNNELAELTSKWGDIVEPFVVSSTRIVSKSGKTAYGEFIVVPRTAEEFVKIPKSQVVYELKKAVNLAKKRGAKIVGLGAYTSVASGGGLLLKDEGIPLTTGNSYTIVAAVEAVTTALERLGTQSDESTAAIVGATGSIGSGVSILLSEKVSKLVLIGNPKNKKSSIKRLKKLTAKIFKHISKMKEEGKQFRPGSLGYKISNLRNLPLSNEPIKKFEKFAEDINNKENFIILTTDIDNMLPLGDIVVSATSNVGKLIKPNHLKSGAVVCDMSRPRNVDEDVARNRPDVLVIDGGIIEVPGLPDLGVDLGFDKGLAYACMSETMILALEGHYKHTSVGSSGINMENILLTRRLAEKHGFKLADFRSFDKPIKEEKWEKILELKGEMATV